MVAIHPFAGLPAAGHQDDALPSEAVWQLLAGVAHNSWEAIFHSSHADVELKPRAAGGISNGAVPSASMPAPATTGNPALATSTVATTPTIVSVASTPAAKTTQAAATAAPTTAEAQVTPPAAASAPAANNGNSIGQATAAAGGPNSGAPAGQSSQPSGYGNDAAAPAGQVLPSSSNGNDGNNDNSGAQASQPIGVPATAAPATAATGLANPNSPPAGIDAPGQTAATQAQPTTTASGGVLLTASSTGPLPSGTLSATPSSSSSDKNDTASSSSGSSHTGAIAGVVVVLVILLVAVALLYRFRRAHFVRKIFHRGSVGKGSTGSTRHGNNRLRGQSAERSSWTPFEGSRTGVSQMQSMAKTAAMRHNGSSATFAAHDEKQSPSVTPMASSTNVAAHAYHDHNDRHSRIDTYRNANLPPPAYPLPAYPPPSYPLPPYPAADPAFSPRPASTSSSVATDDSDSLVGAPHGRARSASRGNYSAFPSAGRPGTHRHDSSTSIPRLQPAPAPSSAGRKDVTIISDVPSQSTVAVTVQLHSAPQVQELSAVNHYTGASAMSASFSTEPGVEVPPPTVKAIRQRDGTRSECQDVVHSRASFGSIGGSSVASSMLMSPTLLQWPVPPQTPTTSSGDAGSSSSATESQTSSVAGPLSSSANSSEGRGAGNVRRPPTARRGQSQTRAPLAGAAHNHVSQQQQQQKSARQPYGQNTPQQYHQQPYLVQQNAPFGHVQPNTPSLTVRTNGQDTSVQIHIAQYHGSSHPDGSQSHFF
ncbi:hypothetical protein SEPCBS119000_002069 [Sporothrix epigloea]|uniref:Uncharacterized protein n=1 Tax=Sporothrix epigloea TaxID=1892477 RepID=A0ABP0DFD3_9PEZI